MFHLLSARIVPKIIVFLIVGNAGKHKERYAWIRIMVLCLILFKLPMLEKYFVANQAIMKVIAKMDQYISKKMDSK